MADINEIPFNKLLGLDYALMILYFSFQNMIIEKQVDYELGKDAINEIIIYQIPK